MIYAPHTFELTLNLNMDKFNKLRDRAYRKAKSSHRMYYEMNKDIDYAFADKGIKIEYHNGIYKKKIKFIVNPTKVLDGDDIKKLWKPNSDNISKLLNKLEKRIDEYFDSKYKLDDFNLTRIDFTVNIDVGDRESVSAYIRVLHNIGKVKGFAPKYDKNDDHIDTNLSFDLEGNSNGVEFAAYNKEAALKNKDKAGKAKGILRVEVRLMKQKAIREYTNETTTSKQIESLASTSQDIFLDTFARIVPYGDYYKKRDAVKIIENKISKRKHREKMLRLLELIPKKKSLYLALKEMNDRNIDKIMKLFDELHLSPITISKRHNIKHLKTLYFYLLSE